MAYFDSYPPDVRAELLRLCAPVTMPERAEVLAVLRARLDARVFAALSSELEVTL